MGDQKTPEKRMLPDPTRSPAGWNASPGQMSFLLDPEEPASGPSTPKRMALDGEVVAPPGSPVFPPLTDEVHMYCVKIVGGGMEDFKMQMRCSRSVIGRELFKLRDSSIKKMDYWMRVEATQKAERKSAANIKLIIENRLLREKIARLEALELLIDQDAGDAEAAAALEMVADGPKEDLPNPEDPAEPDDVQKPEVQV